MITTSKKQKKKKKKKKKKKTFLHIFKNQYFKIINILLNFNNYNFYFLFFTQLYDYMKFNDYL